MNTNGNSYQDQGRAPARPQLESGTRTKISFDPPRVPVILTPEAIPAHPVPGRNGEQYQWLFQGHQIAWFDPGFHAEICACLQVSNCRDIAITKHVRKGTPPRFEVQPVMDETEEATPAPSPRFPPRAPAPAARPNVAATAQRRIAEVKASQPRYHHEERVEAETAPPSNAMAEALMEATLAVHEVSAITGAHGMTIAWRAEDIRALAITIYIQRHGGKR